MTGRGSLPPRPAQDGPGAGSGAGWTAVSYLLGGMAVYGGIGWAIGHWVWHSALFFPLGMVVGLALATVLIIISFGRS
jgi:ATP synthase protein I